MGKFCFASCKLSVLTTLRINLLLIGEWIKIRNNPSVCFAILEIHRKSSLIRGRLFCAIWPESTGSHPIDKHKNLYDPPDFLYR